MQDAGFTVTVIFALPVAPRSSVAVRRKVYVPATSPVIVVLGLAKSVIEKVAGPEIFDHA